MQAQDLPPEALARGLTYAGFVLVGYELVKDMIVGPIKLFYKDSTFGQGMPFKTYDEDVRARHKNEFEACLLYLRDFMEAVDDADFDAIQELRNHRNELAHELVRRLPILRVDEHQSLWERVDRTIFKLSNYRTRMEIGADPRVLGPWNRLGDRDRRRTPAVSESRRECEALERKVGRRVRELIVADAIPDSNSLRVLLPSGSWDMSRILGVAIPH